MMDRTSVLRKAAAQTHIEMRESSMRALCALRFDVVDVERRNDAQLPAGRRLESKQQHSRQTDRQTGAARRQAGRLGRA